jgi:hemerythrin
VLGPSQRLADRALEISQDWLVHHIAEEDAQYVTYVKKRS